MKSSIERPPLQASKIVLSRIAQVLAGSIHTGPNIRVFSEHTTIICPFRSIAIDWPAFANFGHAESSKDFICSPVEMTVDHGLSLFLGDVVSHSE